VQQIVVKPIRLVTTVLNSSRGALLANAVYHASASTSAGDGQRLIGTRMAAAVRCAPPGNKPEAAERDACAPWLAAELRLVAAGLRVVVCLGGFAWQALRPVLAVFTLARHAAGLGSRSRYQ
jgi:uracil-DNA glycosylase